jgi:hypothetical protein
MSDPFDPTAARAPDLDWVDLADALWLAAIAGAGAGAHREAESALPDAPGGGLSPEPTGGQTVDTGAVGDAGTYSAAVAPARPGTAEAAAAARLHGRADGRPIGLARIEAGAGRSGSTALPFGRDIARAMQPFKRRVLSPVEQEPDEEATAERAADDRLWLPQMRPAPTRWLSLAVVVDASPSMEVWRPTVGAFIRLLKQHGSFSRCREFLIVIPDESGGDGYGAGVRILSGSGVGVRHPAELVDPSGRQVILVLTDGHSAGWRSRRISALMRLWGRSGPLAIVNPYPQRYWHRTNLAPSRAQVRAPRAVAPNARLMVRRPPRWRDSFDEAEASGFPVPVLELSARWLRWWARLVTGPGGEWLEAPLFLAGAGYAARAPDAVRSGSESRSESEPQHGSGSGSADREPSQDHDLPPYAASRLGSSRDLVLRFRTAATPLAFRLATHLAAAPLDLTLARRIQRAMLPQSFPHHLAEVVTSDLVRQTVDDTGEICWDFAAGVRDVLLSSATRDDSARVLRMVAGHYGEDHPGAESMAAVIETPERYVDAPLTPEALPMARIKLSVLRALSGPYIQYANHLARSIAAVEVGSQAGRPRSGGAGMGRDARTGPRPGAKTTGVAATPETETALTNEPAATSGATGTAGVIGTTDTARPALGPEPVRIGVGEEMPGPLSEDFGRIPRPGHVPDPYPFPGRGPGIDDVEPDLSVSALFGGQEQDIGPAVWGNVPPKNPAFTGREEMLAQLERRLRTESMTAVLPQALHGMGGVGKSQIAIEYTYRNRSKYELIWWIPSEQPGQILASLAELGLHLGHESDLEANAAVVRVQAALKAGVPYARWLLIFDNAETLDAVRPYFPESGAGKVLVTSRNQEWGQVAQTLEVDVFTRAESIELLKRRNPNAGADDADRLAEALGDLPLAVEHASAWCATTGISMADYLVLLEEKLDELVTVVRAPGYELAVAAAWGVALDRLQEENLPALRLLQVCSFFAPEPIKRELFTSPRMYPTVPELDDALQSPSRLSQVFRDIQKYGLARIDYRTDSIQLHRLVKAVLVGGMAEEEQRRMEHGAHVLLAGGNPGNPDKPAQWDRYQELAPHVTASRMITCEDGWAREMVLHVIEFNFYWGDLISSRDLAQQAVDEWRIRIGRDHLQTLRAGKWLGYVKRTLGQFEAAREINQDCLERYRRTLGANDDGTIDAMSIVAADLRMAGDFLQARELDSDAFDRARRTLGEDDPTTFRAAYSLGVSLRLTGDFWVARRMDNDIYLRRVAILGDTHPETLRTLNGLTLDHRECGAYLQAYELQEHLYARYQSVYGVNNIATIAAGRNLAVARRRAGLHEDGRKLAEEAWRRYQQRFGDDNPETIAAALNYAVDLRESGALDQALRLGEQAAERYHAVLGSDHPHSLYARTNLAIVLRLLGQAQQAWKHNSTVLSALTGQLGRDQILTLTCAVNLASDLSSLGRHDKAREMDEDTVARCRSVLGEEHPTTLAATLNLSFDLTALDRADEGDRLFRETLDKYRRVLGESHPAIAAAADQARANCDVDPMPL